MFRLFVILGSINAFLGVALGAFGAHGLQSKLSEKLMATFETGVQYHLIHALGLLAIAFLCEKLGNSKLVSTAGWSLFAGIIFFSGSLYAYCMTEIKFLVFLTPIGGVFFLLGWVLLTIAAWKRKS
ncbi:DUF423 domain-containing protein [Paenibacillus sp. N1-5-1-14]|uniref:DUF423 domain-containing protein n=1 Tax=Paenibacillus radicibacter TaxID=2972488 RepID=UPI002158E29A|nr:DUF423 domain-containing protein [Paenibacillus radicibacter]MCR8643664.1 DUF423 domain-containing protein [Paenibacillus radicibacter]